MRLIMVSFSDAMKRHDLPKANRANQLTDRRVLPATMTATSGDLHSGTRIRHLTG